MRHFIQMRRWLLPLLLVVGLCSCKAELFERLDERDANEMLATLYSAGLHASKSTHDEKTWSIEVEEHDMPAALRILAEHGLPREQFANAGDLFRKEGLVSTPAEERIRYIYAVSQELSSTLSQIDGVIVARVHPVIPANDPLATQIRPASASVFIKYRRDADLQAMAPPIKNLVMRSIEGLTYENISLIFVAAEGLPRVAAPQSVDTNRGTVRAAMIGGFGMLSVLLLARLGHLWKRHKPLGASPGASGVKSSSRWSWTFHVQ
jgi:type III secretion protein J